MDVVLRKPRLLRALTSLDLGEFMRLEAGLEALLVAERRERTYDGKVRQRAYGAGADKSKLPTSRHKLLFILFHFKSYPTQEVMGVFFGVSQPQVCEWVKRLTLLLGAVLGGELLLPARRPVDMAVLLAEAPELLLLIDVRFPRFDGQAGRRAYRKNCQPCLKPIPPTTLLSAREPSIYS